MSVRGYSRKLISQLGWLGKLEYVSDKCGIVVYEGVISFKASRVSVLSTQSTTIEGKHCFTT